MADIVISFQHVLKKYGESVVLSDVNFEIEKGRFYTLLGPSGCGKTTILRMIAGFTEVTEGSIRLYDRIINEVPANKRQVNTIFQDYALFPHMNVFENIAFGLKIKKQSKKAIAAKVAEVLRLIQLDGFENREILELSGGQQQRIAIARALANEPEVLLLDEPLSALDSKLRKNMQVELRTLQQRLGITFIFVTHDQEEALAMSDKIFVMNEGKIIQSGTPNAIYDEPVNHFVADFVGKSNIIPGRMIADFLVEFAGYRFECADAGMKENESIEVVIRPEDLEVTSTEAGKIVVKISSVLFRGVHYELIGQDEDGNDWIVQTTKKISIGSQIGLRFGPDDIHVMRLNENESEFEARLGQYEERQGKSR